MQSQVLRRCTKAGLPLYKPGSPDRVGLPRNGPLCSQSSSRGLLQRCLVPQAGRYRGTTAGFMVAGRAIVKVVLRGFPPSNPQRQRQRQSMNNNCLFLLKSSTLTILSISGLLFLVILFSCLLDIYSLRSLEISISYTLSFSSIERSEESKAAALPGAPPQTPGTRNLKLMGKEDWYPQGKRSSTVRETGKPQTPVR